MSHSHPDLPERTGGAASPALTRTAMFLAGGVGLLLAGVAVQPRFKPSTEKAESSKVLFPDLADASKAASLEIISYDDELATLTPFKVVQSNGVWVLPSHENYPADAKEQLAAAATELVDRPVLDMVSTNPGDHETYGVIEPDPEKVKPGMTGVGQLVEIRDSSGNKIARLVVGKEDKRPGGAVPQGRTLRFVRRAGQDPVYRVELDTSKFTTDFDAWIEKDLLKLSPWDVRRLVLDDYTCSFGADEASGRLMVSQNRQSRMELTYDDKDAKWAPVELEQFTENKPEPRPLADDEELAAAKLNDLRNALGDLKIIDVVRKPAGLSADLRAEEKFTGDREAVTSLAQRGFFPFASGDILSSNGETIVGMKDGVEYVLRFGAPATTAAPDEPQDAEAGPSKTSGRYLFVMARSNESLIEKPVLEPLPEVPGVPAAGPDGETPAETAPTSPEPAADVPPAEPATDAPAAEPAADAVETEADEDEADGEAADGEAAADPPADAGAEPTGEPAATAGEAVPPSDVPAADAPATTTAADELKAAEEAEAKAQAALEERRRVERENRRKQEEYDEKVKAAQKRVKELNARFADWYYVVSDAEYAKIHLALDGVVQKKPASAAPSAPPEP